MKVKTIKVDIPRMLKKNGATLTVTIKKRGLWRINVGLFFIKLGAAICCMKSEIKETPSVHSVSSVVKPN